TGGWRLPDGYEDWDLLMTLAERGLGGVYVPIVVYRYRQTGTGLIAEKRAAFEAHYRTLQSLHPVLFARRERSERTSAAPSALRLAVRLVAALPFVGVQTKIRLTQLVTHLLWNGGPGATLPILTGYARSLRSRGVRA
ncbi:MAG: hypothetical protein ABUL57_00860, partial [Chloroflexota bacterium]